ncbi:MAG: MetQ/NlpA family ABC transporter substrate-binding protein [Lachnospiraceae bacterium]|nr:MetQ/NlpA family ABC transporter substrate-binding protein [Lachnospiraceae bacterium]
MKRTIAKLLALSLAVTAVAGLSVTASADEDNVITVAASSTPHAEILEAARETLEAEGWELDVEIFSDYVQPNTVVAEGEILVNYFQHTPYLDEFNEEYGTDIVSVAKIHYEPFGIYPGTKSSLDELEDGDVIAVPNDVTNEARALLLLEANGVLTLNEDAGLTATINDIESYSVDVEILEVEAAQVSQYTPEVALVVLNGNYALEAGLSVANDAIAYETSDSEAATTYANIIAVKAGNEDNEGVQALVAVLQSDEIKDYINETYDGAVLPYEETAEDEAADEVETEAVTE